MTTITTKYSIGDVVYHATTATERKQHPCPDCNGTKKWQATAPSGSQYEFPCPRCAAAYNSERDLMLDYSAFAPKAVKRTIGSIQVNTAPGSWGSRYMCHETGIGSGNIYNEKDLYPTEDEALAAATLMAAEQNKTTPWVAKLYDKSLTVSDYLLENAALKNAKDALSNARSMLWNLGDLFSKIEEAEDKDEILEAVSEYKEYDWLRDKSKVEGVAA